MITRILTLAAIGIAILLGILLAIALSGCKPPTAVATATQPTTSASIRLASVTKTTFAMWQSNADLRAACTSTDEAQTYACGAYIMAVSDTFTLGARRTPWCAPRETTLNTLRLVYVSRSMATSLVDRQSDLLAAPAAVIRALAAEWPCAADPQPVPGSHTL